MNARGIAWRNRGLILLCTLLAFALRVWQLGTQSLWYDEGVSWYLSARLPPGDMLWWTATDIQPPLYYLLLRPWLLLAGDTEFALRFPSLIFGVLTVPLMVVVAWQLFGARAGVLAGLLSATAPLYVWYAQETRMYTLLTFLGLLATYLLLRALDQSALGVRRRLLLTYTLVSALALYTHYFAAFLLAFHFLYGLIHRRLQSKISSFQLPVSSLLLSQFLAVVAFLPWLPFMFLRLGADVSYWQGVFKLDEALRHVLISFSVGESVLEDPARWLTVGFVLVFIVAVIALLRQPSRRRALLFCALYLLVPVLLILALAAVTPKFNPRYLMFASPPVYILLGAGLVVLTCQASREAIKRHASRITHHVSRFTFCAFLLFILSAFIYADYNLHTDPAFTKASFRDAIHYVEAHKRPDEPVLICSGHMFPVFSYYYRADDWTPLPATRILDVNHILTFDVANDLNRTLVGKAGVWLVLWQEEVADPVGFLFKLLDDTGEQIPTDAVLWQVRIRHYRLPPGTHFSVEPAIQHPLSVRFGDPSAGSGQKLIVLHGYDQDNTRLTLYWSALRPLDRDYKVTIRLIDSNDHVWGQQDERPANYLYPTTRWQPGQLLFGQHEVPVQSDTPPGEYTFEVGLYDAASGQRLSAYDEAGQLLPGDRILLGQLIVQP